MEASPPRLISRLFERAARTLERVECRRALSPEDMKLVYRARLEAYSVEKLLTQRHEGHVLGDPYDNLPNHWNMMTLVDGAFAGAFRIHVGSGENAILPSLSTFHDLLEPFLRHGCVVVDTSQIATRAEFASKFPELPYIAIRAVLLAAGHFGADLVTLPCVREHQSFYLRFGFQTLNSRRAGSLNSRKIVCMVLDYHAQKERLQTRFPLFVSSEGERQKIFGEISPSSCLG